MEITNELIDHIAHLSRLEFDGQAKNVIKQDVSNMIAFVEQLNKIDTDDVEPLIFMTESINVLREDVSRSTVSQEDALKNAANHDSDYFKIAKVLRQ
jgi:aspartyl-tRNA(Asn)/glutamyl-tRNA(Gln) amidotransferase subunit C